MRENEGEAQLEVVYICTGFIDRKLAFVCRSLPFKFSTFDG